MLLLGRNPQSNTNLNPLLNRELQQQMNPEFSFPGVSQQLVKLDCCLLSETEILEFNAFYTIAVYPQGSSPGNINSNAASEFCASSAAVYESTTAYDETSTSL